MNATIQTHRGPVVPCHKIETAPPGSWREIESFFSGADLIHLTQAWRVAPQPQFRPAEVRIAWNTSGLQVYAVLEDEDIFNPETRFNEPSFLRGDVFELFLRPVNQDAYYEFHITPANQHFQLRIPSADAFRAARGRPGIPSEWILGEPAFTSRVEVNATERRWRIFASIPLSRIEENGPAAEWRYSFSRYDYTRGIDAPVLSSTSRHAVLNFHVQEDWGTLQFSGRATGS